MYARVSQPRGFTLLELLLVFALLAMLIGLVGPSGLRALESARQRSHMRSLDAVLRALPVEAFASGRSIELDALHLQRRLPDWPAGWRLELSQPLAYSAEGVARGGIVTVRSEAPPQRLRVEPGSGRILPE